MVSLRRFTKEDVRVIREQMYPDLTEDRIAEIIDEWDTVNTEGTRSRCTQ